MAVEGSGGVIPCPVAQVEVQGGFVGTRELGPFTRALELFRPATAPNGIFPDLGCLLPEALLLFLVPSASPAARLLTRILFLKLVGGLQQQPLYCMCVLIPSCSAPYVLSHQPETAFASRTSLLTLCFRQPELQPPWQAVVCTRV